MPSSSTERHAWSRASWQASAVTENPPAICPGNNMATELQSILGIASISLQHHFDC